MLNEIKLKDLMETINLLKNEDCRDKILQDNRYVIVRTYSAGVFAGNLYSKKDKEVILHNARRLWKWSGAASLSQLAMEGVKDPNNCKFPCEVNSICLLETIEIIDCTDNAKKSIKSVPEWKN